MLLEGQFSQIQKSKRKYFHRKNEQSVNKLGENITQLKIHTIMEIAMKCLERMTANFPNSKKYKPTDESSSGKKYETGLFKARRRTVTPGMWGTKEGTPSSSQLAGESVSVVSQGGGGGSPVEHPRGQSARARALCRHRVALE